MSPLHHGISIRDAAMLIGVPEGTVRMWLNRGHVHRTPDGQVDPFTLQEWWETKRDAQRGSRGEVHRSKSNPFDHPGAPSRKTA